MEEVYWTYSFSPVYDDNDAIGGVLVTVSETTQQVIGERQLLLLKELAAKTLHGRTVTDACTMALEALNTNKKDIPFSLLYLTDDTYENVERVAYTGFTGNEYQAGKSFPIDDTVWPFATIMKTGSPLIIETGALPRASETSWPGSPAKSVVLPLPVAGHSTTRGFIIMGLNPMRLYDENYYSFTNLIANHISSAIANAEVYENERRKSESLAEIDRAKTIFFSNVSHELRTPLTLMLGPLHELLNDKKAAPYRDVINMAYRNGIRLQKLVNGLLDFSRIEAGRFEAAYYPTNLGNYTMDLASNFRAAIEKAGIKFTVVTTPTREKIYIDPGMWEKIVFNLLSNAFKFTFEGEIKVEVKEDAHNAYLIVSDTGTGIAQEDLSAIFTRFKRIEGAKSRSIEGSGIGLSLVYELVKLHDGTIDVQSQVNKGATFTVAIPKGNRHLPAGQVQDAAVENRYGEFEAYVQEAERWVNDLQSLPEQQATPVSTGKEKKPRIVVTDDNTDMRRYIQRLLSARFEVVCVPDGQAALEAIYKEHTDMLITDYMMPGMDGFELLKILKSGQDTARIPVIILSARADEQARLACIEAGVDDYLVKPFNANELLARASSIIVNETKYKVISAKLEELVKERTRELERSNDDLQQFAHVASHDLKEPVRKIKVFTNLLETQFGNSLPPVARTYLQKVHSSADRMKAMIEGVLQYSSVSNHVSEDSAPVDLNEVLKGVEKELELLLHEKQGVIQFSPMPVLDGVYILLFQLFYNLINNSLKFSRAGVPAVIAISTTLHPESNSVTIHVADNGIGFDAKNMEKIFNPFTRLNPKDEYEGTGLGLALCKKIVERHGGKITAVSQQGVGSIFHVTLPITQHNKNQ
jgi:signal transduction histidine kinase